MSDTNLLFIAEFACIHEGDGDYLVELARAAREAGADAVKFQVFDPDEIVAPGHPDHAYFRSICFTTEQWVSHIGRCADLGLDVWMDVSGRFSLDVVRAAEGRVAGVKIHSADIDNAVVFEGVRELGERGLPVAIGCGGTPLIDLFELLDALGPAVPVVLMHGYQAFPKLEGAAGGPPAKGVVVEDLELWRIRQLAQTFPNARVGLADHLAGDDPMAVGVPAVAVALGASVIEKHVTLRRADRREDYFSALEPSEFRAMVEGARSAAAAVGSDAREMGEGENGYRREMKRTAVAARKLSAHEALAPGALELVRDGSYVSGARAGRLVGRSPHAGVAAGTHLTEALLQQKVGVFCNARTGSSRLPGKALLPFYGGYTALGYLLKRLTSYPGDIGEVVLATTHLPDDDALEAIAGEVGVPCFRGEPADVMGRMVQTADAFGWDVLVRATGDDQFVSCEYIEKALAYHLENSLDYTRIAGLPVGMACEVIDVRTLRRVHEAIVNRAQTEYVTWYLDSQWTCRNGLIQAEPAHRHERFRVTLDYQEDYDVMRELARRAHAAQDGFYVSIDRLIETLIDMDPAWTHHEELWPLERADVDVSLVYRAPAENSGTQAP